MLSLYFTSVFLDFGQQFGIFFSRWRKDARYLGARLSSHRKNLRLLYPLVTHFTLGVRDSIWVFQRIPISDSLHRRKEGLNLKMRKLSLRSHNGIYGLQGLSKYLNFLNFALKFWKIYLPSPTSLPFSLLLWYAWHLQLGNTLIQGLRNAK